MIDFRVALTELLRKGSVEDPEFLHEGVRVLAQGLMELEVAQKIRAERYERSQVNAPLIATDTATGR